jgi:hypothetical protein
MTDVSDTVLAASGASAVQTDIALVTLAVAAIRFWNRCGLMLKASEP